MNNRNRLKFHGVLGIFAGIVGIVATVTGHFFVGAIAFGAGFLALWNMGNIKDQIREGKTQ